MVVTIRQPIAVKQEFTKRYATHSNDARRRDRDET